MTHLSVNDHLEGILSDFEALKRSFDMEDIDNTSVFSPTSPHSSTFGPSKSNVNRTSNGDIQISTGLHQPLYNSCIQISSSCSPSLSPVLKSRITSSLSFNRGTMQMAKTNGSTGQGLTRVFSFQTRLHPCGFTSSAHGSDNDSLHSSTSSLECPPTTPFQPLHPTHNSVGQHESNITIPNVTSPVLKKISSHGNVFHSKIERPGVCMVPVPTKSNGSLPSLELHIAEDNVPDLVPSSDAGYPPSEGWSSPPPASSSRNAKSISREPSFSSSSSSSSPPKECTPINCDLTSPSPPPIFGPLQQTTLQKFPLSLRSPFGKPNGLIPEQFNRPLPRTQLRVNLNSTSGITSQVNTEKTDITLKSQPHISSIGRSSSLNYNSPVSPNLGSRLPSSVLQDSLQDSNFNHNLKPHEFHSSSGRLRSLMQRANSFSNADNVLNQFVAVNEKSTGYLAHPLKTVQEPSITTGTQGNGNSSFTTYLQSNQKNQRFTDSIFGIPPIKTSIREHMVPLAVIPFKQPEAPLRLSEDFEDGKLNIRDSDLADLDYNPRPEGFSSPIEELSLPAEETMELKICEELGREPFGYVGIDSVLEQMKRKAMKHGFEFNIMVVGQSGLGKSTLVNTLFKSKVINKTPGAGIPKTLELKAISQVIEERGVEMRLTIIDTPGFGDQINNQNCWDPIIKYIYEQYEKYLREEILVNRKRCIPDSRIHSCIYFIPPTGHWLRPLDLEFMKRLGHIVNVVPVIAKADTLTLEEREEFKKRIRKDLQAHGISVYPQPELDEDTVEMLLNDKIREKIPFAVVGTDEEHQVNGRRVLGRKTKWGIIEVENTSHCEFSDLRDLLIRSNLQDLKDITHNIHYESYRVNRLNQKINGVTTQLKDLSTL